MSMQVRCVDAAREAARLAARGDDTAARRAAQAVAPHGATLRLDRDGAYIVATVSARSAVLPVTSINARAVAAIEPGVG